jgi:hypothetical protein
MGSQDRPVNQDGEVDWELLSSQFGCQVREFRIGNMLTRAAGSDVITVVQCGIDGTLESRSRTAQQIRRGIWPPMMRPRSERRPAARPVLSAHRARRAIRRARAVRRARTSTVKVAAGDGSRSAGDDGDGSSDGPRADTPHRDSRVAFVTVRRPVAPSRRCPPHLNLNTWALPSLERARICCGIRCRGPPCGATELSDR